MWLITPTVEAEVRFFNGKVVVALAALEKITIFDVVSARQELYPPNMPRFRTGLVN